MAGFNIFLHDRKLNELIIKRMILLWLAAGISEIFFPGLMQILTPGARTTASRGVTGLSMEPSFYGYTCFFFMIMAMKFRTGRVKYCALCVFQIIFLAKSAVGVLYLFVLSGVYIFFTGSIRRRITLIILSVLMLVAVVIAVNNIASLRQSRLVSLIIRIFENPNILQNAAKISETDASVAQRVHAITFGTGDFFTDMGLPHGFMYEERIMSGYGAVLYELGIFGLAVIVMITKRLSRSFGFPAAMAVSVVMFSAVQLASPTFIFLVAIAEYEAYKKKLRYIELK